MKPILVTTPRSGSTLIESLLFNIARQKFGYKNDLLEPFTITELFKAEYVRENDIVRIDKFQRVGTKWFDDKRQVKLDFLNLIKDDYNYMMKLFPIDMEPEIMDMLLNHMDVICLERRDKLHQALSWVLLWETNKAHYKKSDPQTVKSMRYVPFHAKEMVRHLKAYKEFKETYTGYYDVLVYEDFMENGANEDALIKLLNLPVKDYIKSEIDTKPTPYEKSLEDMIINKDEWIADRDSLIKAINEVS